MPTKLKRYMISLPADLQAFIEKEAEMNHRPVASQMMVNLYTYYATRKQEAAVFNSLDEGAPEVPVYRTKEPFGIQGKVQPAEGQGKNG